MRKTDEIIEQHEREHILTCTVGLIRGAAIVSEPQLLPVVTQHPHLMEGKVSLSLSELMTPHRLQKEQT